MKLSSPGPKALAVLLVAVGAIAILYYYWIAAGGTPLLTGHRYTITAEIPDSQGLLKHADVRAAGVKVGQVSNITNTSTASGTLALVQLQLNGTYAPVYRNATVLVRQKTLVGENYIEITRGTPSAGVQPDNSALPMAADQQSVPLDKILNSLTPDVRRHAQIDLQSLGAGLNDEGQNLNGFLGALEPTVQNGNQLLGVLDAQRGQVADVIDQTGTVFHALADRTQALQTLIRSGVSTAQAVAARDEQLVRSFDALPSTLAQARTSVSTLTSFSGDATPVVANLRTAMTKLDPVMHELEPTAASAKQLFALLPGFIKQANPLLTKLQSFTGVAKPVIPAVDSLMAQADPMIAYLKPYYRDIGSFLENFGGTIQREVKSGVYIGRCTCPISAASFANYTPAEQKLVRALIRAGGLGGIANPNDSGIRASGTAPDASAQYSGTYPHVLAMKPLFASR